METLLNNLNTADFLIRERLKFYTNFLWEFLFLVGWEELFIERFERATGCVQIQLKETRFQFRSKVFFFFVFF